jgi:hypothetical protein
MPPPKNPQKIKVFNEITQFYKCFITNFITIMAPIIKLIRNTLLFGLRNARRLRN